MTEPTPLQAADPQAGPRRGTLWGVSLGPGDPGLITRAAWAALQRRDVAWAYPARSGKTPSYALDIATRAGLTPPEQHSLLLFPMTHDGEKLARAWLKAAHTLLPWLQAGRDVLFLVEGDASTYATFGHLARTLRALDAEVPVQVLPGVNSFTAACAQAGVPFAEQDDTVAIVPAAYGLSAVERLLPDFDTLVLMKIKPLLDELLDWLQRRGLLAGAHFIERVGAPDERRVSGTDLLALRGTRVSYLSLLLVKNPGRVRGERIKGCLKKSGSADVPKPPKPHPPKPETTTKKPPLSPSPPSCCRPWPPPPKMCACAWWPSPAMVPARRPAWPWPCRRPTSAPRPSLPRSLPACPTACAPMRAHCATRSARCLRAGTSWCSLSRWAPWCA